MRPIAPAGEAVLHSGVLARRGLTAASVLILTLLIAGCSSGSYYFMRITDDLTLRPADVQLHENNQAVKWSNESSSTVRLVDDKGAFDVELQPGGTFLHSYSLRSGEHPYSLFLDGELIATGTVGTDESESLGTADGSTTSTVAPSPTGSAEPVPQASWRLETLDSGIDDGMTAVDAGPDGFTAVGWSWGYEQVPQVWTSPDGEDWTVVSGSRRGSMLDVTSGPTMSVSVGWHEFPDRPVAWFSTGPGNWEQGAMTDPPNDDFLVRMIGVAATDRGWIAVGSELPVGYTEARRSVVWTSSDGRSWNRTATISGVPSQMRSVMSVDGTYWAAGWVAPDGDEKRRRAAVWTSPNSADWFEVAGPWDPTGIGPETMIYDIDFGPSGMVAVGWEGDLNGNSVAAIWRSPDGRTWNRVPGEAIVPGSGVGEATSVSWIGDRWVAIGHENANPVLWESSDSRGWNRADPAPGSGMIPRGVAVHQGVALIVGGTETGGFGTGSATTLLAGGFS